MWVVVCRNILTMKEVEKKLKQGIPLLPPPTPPTPVTVRTQHLSSPYASSENVSQVLPFVGI